MSSTLLRKVVTAQEEQRARIARDLHDQFGQQLTALRLTLDRYRDRLPGRRGRSRTDPRARDAGASDIDAELDFLAWELRPAVLDDLGLVGRACRGSCANGPSTISISAEFRATGVEPGAAVAPRPS